jgi:hypothetical protein
MFSSILGVKLYKHTGPVIYWTLILYYTNPSGQRKIIYREKTAGSILSYFSPAVSPR